MFYDRTLHKQGMYGGLPSVKRTLIITPGSLVKVYFFFGIYSRTDSILDYNKTK